MEDENRDAMNYKWGEKDNDYDQRSYTAISQRNLQYRDYEDRRR